MPRLPIPGSDDGSWGDILNAYLLQSLAADGSIRTGVVGSSQLADNAVTSAKLAPSAVTTSHLSTGSVTNSAIADGAIAQGKIANLSGDLAGKAASVHTHTASQISDTSTAGRSLMTAADAATQRSALGLGNAATLTVGTTAGTVAAGDDSRLTGALQTSGLDAATAAVVANATSETRASLSSTFARGRTITVGSGRDYETIQEAIDDAGDAIGAPVTIYVYPGTYARFSMVGWPNQTGDWTQNRRRYISLIGMGTQLGDVVVQDDTGDYRTPPAEIRTVGLVKGITFVATHDTPFVDAVEEALARRSYAVHMDFGSQDVVFEDCELISMHAPGAGIGFHNQERITFRRCHLISHADGTYGGLLNYGAIFAHSGSGNNNTAQHLILDQVDALCPNGDRAVWLSVSGNFINCEMTVKAIGVNAYCADASPVVRDTRITVTPDSRNNNDTALAPATWPAQMAGLTLPGATTDYVTCPDHARLDITGDLEIIWHGSLADWSNGAVQGLVSKYVTTGNQRSYALSVQSLGKPYFSWTTDGTSGTQVAITGTTAVPFADGASGWLKATLDVNNGAGGNDVKFYTSTDGTTWSQLGTTVTTAGVTSIYSGTAPVMVGVWTTLVAAAGTVAKRAIIKNGIGGTVVANWDGRVPASRYRDPAGNYWTIVGSGSTWTAA